MKQVNLQVYVLEIGYGDGDHAIYLYADRDEAVEHMYGRVSEDWNNRFDEDDPIDDYEKESAVDHYYEYAENESYSIDLETVTFPLDKLQDAIATAINLVTSDG